MKSRIAIIVVQQESLRERPRVEKFANVLAKLGVGVEIWKFGPAAQKSELGIPVRNLMDQRWRQRATILRYIVWMLSVVVAWCCERRRAAYFAIGFDSAFPLAVMPGSPGWLVFDNLDNISLNYRWPKAIASVFRWLEKFTAHRSKLHVVPSRARWQGSERNLRIVTNTPSRDAVDKARQLAAEHGYVREDPLTIYVNGWLSPTRGIRTLVSAIHLLRKRGVSVRVLVAGRPASPESKELIEMEGTRYLGMLTNVEALAVYFQSHLAFTYYDPSIGINRVAESQKWTDCWATGTPFISNLGIHTLQPYLERDACFALDYGNAEALAELLANLASHRERLSASRQHLQQMSFRYWDDEMSAVACDWLDIVPTANLAA